MSFPVGSLVRARGREWVVLPESENDLLVLRPLGGGDSEVTGIFLPLEPVEPAHFELPDPSLVGDHHSCRFLRDAVRLSSRSSAGPFRSMGKIAVEPRPYQIVPLLMALRQSPVRMLISDDVGVGKTIEACLVVRELLDRGEISRLAVLCPPHLAEQWKKELYEKFHVEAEAVLTGTAARLERKYRLRMGQSLFDVCPFTVVSMDFIKSDRRMNDFIRSCPELVIIDEAHTCAFGYAGRGGRHQRHQLVKRLVEDAERHIILVTATPHSGNEQAFRSLLSFLDPEFSSLPEDLTGTKNERHRRRLAVHFIQRRRGDIRHFMQTDTPFPEREEAEATFSLSPEYRKFFDRVLSYTREKVKDESGGKLRQRVRWWSALALLRSVGSSPAAAAATLRNRSATADAESEEEVEEIGRRTVLDLLSEDEGETPDVAPGGETQDDTEPGSPSTRRLRDLAREAEKLAGDKDHKLQEAIELVKKLLADNYSPILFCRFIPTAEYVAKGLRDKLPRDVEISCVTGVLPPADREARVADLAAHPKRVLVCTECLGEGINLQDNFDAVMHYDLSWNPTRHEQREGRVDRFGQARDKVRVITYYGIDNPIDGIVIDVLIRKHKKIRSSLGISVPVPVDTDAVVEAIFEGLLFREQSGQDTKPYLPGFEDFLKPKKEDFYLKWDNAAEREKRSRTMFAQETISVKAEEVARELDDARRAIGSSQDVQAFTIETLKSCGALVSEKGKRHQFNLSETPRALKDMFEGKEKFEARFELPVDKGVLHLSRTHPYVESLANYVLDTALDPEARAIARRAGAIRTRAVEKRATLLVVRFRYDLVTRIKDSETRQLAEECRLLAFSGAPSGAQWLDDKAAEELLNAEPHQNTPPEQAEAFVKRVADDFDSLVPRINEEAGRRAKELLEAHQRVRKAAQIKGAQYSVEPQLPADVIGIYVYLPVASEGN